MKTTFENNDNAEKLNIEYVETLEMQKDKLEQEVLELKIKLKLYEEQLKLKNKKIFGSSSEKTQCLGQIEIFNEPEVEANLTVAEPDVELMVQKRKKQVGAKENKMKALVEEVIHHTFPEEEMKCEACGNTFHVMKQNIQYFIEIRPAEVFVSKHVTDVVACRNCEKTKDTTPIKTAPRPNSLLPKSSASPSAVAYIMTQKFVQGVPLYRQEKEFETLGYELPRQTMSNWVILSTRDWLSFIYDKMREILVKQDILHADETSVQVLREDGRSASSESYMWQYRTGREGPSIILYDYKTTRAGKHPAEFLKGFKGYIHCDGYAGYNKLVDVTLVGCWAHARRKFDEALKTLPKETDPKTTLAYQGLMFCNKLFEIESKLLEETNEKRYNERIELSKPVIDEYYKWLKSNRPRIVPGSALGKAINYSINQWDSLNKFFNDGRLEIHNNRAERTFKPFVIGRKNWLFSVSPDGANSSAVIYSIIQTAKENGLKPFEYLKYLFEQLPNIDTRDSKNIEALLPWSKELPEHCKLNKPEN